MRVLITGGAGFIGSHLAELLLERGVEVRVFDSLISGRRERVPAAAEFIQGDIRDRAALAAAMEGVTHVAHLAALVSVPISMADPLTTHEVNVTGTENVLDAMRQKGVVRIVYATSAAVYGDEPSLPKRETSPLLPQSPYALSKAVNEMQAGMYERTYGLSSAGLRFFNVYGPGQAGNHPYASVIPRWIEAVRAGKGITVYGDGSQTRDFVHVRDVAAALYQALMADATGVFNIASGEEVSLKQLYELIAEISGDDLDVKNDAPRAGDIVRSVADISRAREMLGFVPSVEFRKGVEELVKA
jgi:nucleoside-diphosphate-sugar epimerase